MTLFGFPAKLRLLRATEFKTVFDHASIKVHQQAFMLLAVPCAGHARLGLVIAKRKIRHAHERNRVKRLARESFRLHQTQLPALDIVLMAKADAQTLPNDVIHEQLNLAWRQLTKRYQKNQQTISPDQSHKNQPAAKKSTENVAITIDLVKINPIDTQTPFVTRE